MSVTLVLDLIQVIHDLWTIALRLCGGVHKDADAWVGRCAPGCPLFPFGMVLRESHGVRQVTASRSVAARGADRERRPREDALLPCAQLNV